MIPYLKDSIAFRSRRFICIVAFTLLPCVSVAQVSTYASRILIKSAFVTVAGRDAIAACDLAGCTAMTPLLPTFKAICPVPASHTCTLVLTPVAEVYASYATEGLPLVGFFLPHVTGADPAKEQFFQFFFDPSSATGQFSVSQVSTFTFVVPVTNTVQNQAHSVTVYLGCMDAYQTGHCRVETSGGGSNGNGIGYRRAATLRMDIYKP